MENKISWSVVCVHTFLTATHNQVMTGQTTHFNQTLLISVFQQVYNFTLSTKSHNHLVLFSLMLKVIILMVHAYFLTKSPQIKFS